MPAMVLALALLIESPAPPPPPAIDGLPRWLAKPSGQDFLKVYPRRAMAKRLAGRAVISCSLLATGRLADCVVAEETPAESGFGAAALRLAPKVLLSPVDQDGKSIVGGTVRIPLVWNPPPN
jgi:protein TonB